MQIEIKKEVEGEVRMASTQKNPERFAPEKSEFLARKKVEKKIVLMENKNDICNDHKKWA